MAKKKKQSAQATERAYDNYVASTVPDVMLTQSEAVKMNRDTPNNAFMQKVGDEFYYPEELMPAVAFAGLSEPEYRRSQNIAEGNVAANELSEKQNEVGSRYVAPAFGATLLAPFAIGAGAAAVANPGAVGNAMMSSLRYLQPSTYLDPLFSGGSAVGLGAPSYYATGARTLAGGVADALMDSYFAAEGARSLGRTGSAPGELFNAMNFLPLVAPTANAISRGYNSYMGARAARQAGEAATRAAMERGMVGAIHNASGSHVWIDPATNKPYQFINGELVPFNENSEWIPNSLQDYVNRQIAETRARMDAARDGLPRINTSEIPQIARGSMQDEAINELNEARQLADDMASLRARVEGTLPPLPEEISIPGLDADVDLPFYVHGDDLTHVPEHQLQAMANNTEDAALAQDAVNELSRRGVLVDRAPRSIRDFFAENPELQRLSADLDLNEISTSLASPDRPVMDIHPIGNIITDEGGLLSRDVHSLSNDELNLVLNSGRATEEHLIESGRRANRTVQDYMDNVMFEDLDASDIRDMLSALDNPNINRGLSSDAENYIVPETLRPALERRLHDLENGSAVAGQHTLRSGRQVDIMDFEDNPTSLDDYTLDELFELYDKINHHSLGGSAIERELNLPSRKGAIKEMAYNKQKGRQIKDVVEAWLDSLRRSFYVENATVYGSGDVADDAVRVYRGAGRGYEESTAEGIGKLLNEVVGEKAGVDFTKFDTPEEYSKAIKYIRENDLIDKDVDIENFDTTHLLYDTRSETTRAQRRLRNAKNAFNGDQDALKRAYANIKEARRSALTEGRDSAMSSLSQKEVELMESEDALQRIKNSAGQVGRRLIDDTLPGGRVRIGSLSGDSFPMLVRGISYNYGFDPGMVSAQLASNEYIPLNGMEFNKARFNRYNGIMDFDDPDLIRYYYPDFNAESPIGSYSDLHRLQTYMDSHRGDSSLDSMPEDLKELANKLLGISDMVSDATLRKINDSIARVNKKRARFGEEPLPMARIIDRKPYNRLDEILSGRTVAPAIERPDIAGLKHRFGGTLLRRFDGGGRFPVFSPLADFRSAHSPVRESEFRGFGGGNFGGAGASARFDIGLDPLVYEQYVRNTPIMDEISFSDAYSRARKAGLKEFDFNGRRYNTDYDPNAKIGPRVTAVSPVLNIREVLDENKNPISDSTRVEPYTGQIPGVHRKDYGGLIEKYGADQILKAIERRKERLK